MLGYLGFHKSRVPFVKANGLPIGLSFIANRKSRFEIIKMGNQFVKSLQGDRKRSYMKLATVKVHDAEEDVIVHNGKKIFIRDINRMANVLDEILFKSH